MKTLDTGRPNNFFQNGDTYNYKLYKVQVKPRQ